MIGIDDFKKIRAERHLIILDTNILLELYRQPANISLDVIEALKQITDNLFIPRQVYDEYLRNYQAICGVEKKKYQRVSKELSESTRKLQDDILTKITEYRKHNYTDISQLQRNLDEKISNIHDIIKTFEREHQAEKQLSLDFLDHDKVKEFVDFLDSNGKIEEPLNFSKRLSILQEGKVRFDNLIPPGYMDCEKEGADKYGDLFVWKSIMKVAKEKNANIIFVCNDIKEDWWDKDGDVPCELRKELLDEFKEYNPFLNIHFVTLDRFFSCLSEELHIGNSKSALQLSAMDDARLLVDEHNEAVNKKIREFLQTIDIVKEIDEEFIEVGDEDTYLEIESVSVEKEGKRITYYINLCVSALVDLIFQEPGEYPYPAGKEALDINGKLIINKEEYATASDIVNLEITLNEMRYIEPEIWNLMKTVKEGMACKQLIKANDLFQQYKNMKKIRNMQAHLDKILFDEILIEKMNESLSQYTRFQRFNMILQKLNSLTKAASGESDDENMESYEY
jgi:rRNA-processing protein FCF1